MSPLFGCFAGSAYHGVGSCHCDEPGDEAISSTGARPRLCPCARNEVGRSVMDKRIVVVGAGAIGGYTGGNLAHNGFDVTLVDPWPEHVEAIRKDGLSLEGITPQESAVAHPKTLHLTELQHLAKERPIDIAFISMKSYDTEWATTMIRQY